MSRLIFFSGGVESTALLCHAGPNDTVITMNHWYPHEVKTYDHTTVEKNAAHFGLRINYVDIKIPTLPGLYGRDHQIASFISVAHLWVAKDKSIKEIWSGRNSAEVPDPTDLSIFKVREHNAWEFAHPNIPFHRPLEHLSKLEQWRLIPDIVKPLVKTCIYHKNCGHCFKCVEFQQMLTQHD